MEEIRQQEYVSNIPSTKLHQTQQKNEDVEEGGVTPLPFRIYLESFKETKTQIFASKDRNKYSNSNMRFPSSMTCTHINHSTQSAHSKNHPSSTF